ncbi:MAG: TlpA family protein disulfide reductase [Anaerolineae bacterium]|nr:TlpA family protein disulfide reductase [Anaerolineae bacterium]
MASPRHTKKRHRSRKNQLGQINPSFIVLGSVLAIIIAIAAMVYFSQEDEGSNVLVVPDSEWIPRGDTFTPDFTLAGLEIGSSVSLADYRGSYVMINFWATWCPPCRAEMPDLYAYYNQQKDNNFVLLAVNVSEDAATVQAFLDANGFDFPVALDTTGAVYERYGGNGLPSSYLIDPEGRVIKAWRPGAVAPSTLASDISPLLNG